MVFTDCPYEFKHDALSSGSFLDSENSRILTEIPTMLLYCVDTSCNRIALLRCLKKKALGSQASQIEYYQNSFLYVFF